MKQNVLFPKEKVRKKEIEKEVKEEPKQRSMDFLENKDKKVLTSMP